VICSRPVSEKCPIHMRTEMAPKIGPSPILMRTESENLTGGPIHFGSINGRSVAISDPNCGNNFPTSKKFCYKNFTIWRASHLLLSTYLQHHPLIASSWGSWMRRREHLQPTMESGWHPFSHIHTYWVQPGFWSSTLPQNYSELITVAFYFNCVLCVYSGPNSMSNSLCGRISCFQRYDQQCGRKWV